MPQSHKLLGGKTYNSDPSGWKADTQKYCGLEALVKDPVTGRQMLMYIGDAFDDQYVKVSRLSSRNTTILETETSADKGLHRHHDRRVLEHPRQPRHQQE